MRNDPPSRVEETNKIKFASLAVSGIQERTGHTHCGTNGISRYCNNRKFGTAIGHTRAMDLIVTRRSAEKLHS